MFIELEDKIGSYVYVNTDNILFFDSLDNSEYKHLPCQTRIFFVDGKHLDVREFKTDIHRKIED